MTEKEAIQALKLEGGLEITGKAKRVADFFAGLDMAITALKKIQQYREIGTVEECREAVWKQKPKKPDIYTDTRNMVDLHGKVYTEQANVYLCPTCESFIGYVGNNIFHYCPVCGQAIDENLEGMEYE